LSDYNISNRQSENGLVSKIPKLISNDLGGIHCLPKESNC